MVDRPQSSRDPTQDVLAAIQEVIDAPHLPFPDGNPLWKTDVKKAGDERATDARLAQLEELIEYVQRDIAEIKTTIRDAEVRGIRRSDLPLHSTISITSVSPVSSSNRLTGPLGLRRQRWRWWRRMSALAARKPSIVALTIAISFTWKPYLARIEGVHADKI